MATLNQADIGIERNKQEELAQSLQSTYSEREAIANQIRAARWNIQGNRSAELAQVLAAIAPQSQQYQSRSDQESVLPFPSAEEIAERISTLGRNVPSNYRELDEYSNIESSPHDSDPQQNAEYLAKACEQFAKTARKAIQVARKAEDEASAQTISRQLRPVEALATRLRRFS